jgi:hypothetical protein
MFPIIIILETYAIIIFHIGYFSTYCSEKNDSILSITEGFK